MKGCFAVVAIAASVLSVISTGAALADTRTDVLRRAEHCATLPMGRLWLDCYYAAAQPARSELGLPPAPQTEQFQPIFAQPAPASTMTPAAAAPADDDEDDGGLLSLFRGIKVPPAKFGLPGEAPGPGLNVDHIIERIDSFYFSADGFVVSLANGQVWKQIQGDKAQLSKSHTYTAIITRGALNTFNLRVREGKRTNSTVYKVVRVQ